MASVTDLTDLQRAWLYAYLGAANFDQAKAARIAGYQASSAVAFAVIGHENRHHPVISELVEQHLDANAMTAKEVLMRLAEQARGDLGNMFRIVDYPVTEEQVNKETGARETVTVGYERRAVLDIANIIENGRSHLLKSYSQTQHGERVEMYDAQAALVHIGKAHGMFKDRVEHSGRINVHELSDDELEALARAES